VENNVTIFCNLLRVLKSGRNSGLIMGIKVIHLKKVYLPYKKIGELEIK